jgi:DNA-binding NarL/FixJ family response regulator
VNAALTPPGGPIRVLLAEDHALVRAGLRALLAQLRDVEIVGEARDGPEAMGMVESTNPDVVLMDITMPGLSGLQVAARVTAEHPHVRVVMVSMHDNEEYVWQALRAGAAGYLLKDASTSELELAVQSVARGGTYLSPAVSRHVVADYLRRGPPENGVMDRLTPRQREIVQLIAEGQTNQEIAGSLGVSLKTIETHRAQLMDRLEIHDVAGLVRFAIRTGLVPPDR